VRTMGIIDRYVVRRDDNVVHVNFEHEPDPPAPRFPGASSLRVAAVLNDMTVAIAPEMATTQLFLARSTA